MRKPARLHHYVPQGYLAGFTDCGTRDGQLCVYDWTKNEVFRTKPRNVAAERDFNRVEIDGQDPDVMERALGEFEDRAISVIRGSQARDELPADEEFSFVITLMALFAVRNPRYREIMNKAIDREVRVIGDLLASDQDLCEYEMARAKAAGFVPQDIEVSFEDIRQFIRDNQYTVNVSTHESLLRELRVHDDMVQLLGKRYWTLMTAATDAPDFVTCDHPVTVIFKDPNIRGPIGYGLPRTRVLFPLNTRQALLGVFEDPLPEGVEVKAGLVAQINTHTAGHAKRWVYSKTATLTVLGNHGMFTLPYPKPDK
jgi:hypothetical protein